MIVANAYHRKRVLVSKEFTFDASHKLNDYDGECSRWHGHTYRVIIGVSGKTSRNGLVLDFKILKSIWEDNIKPTLDHHCLNETLPEMNTTAENIVYWVFNRLEVELAHISQELQVEFIKLYETPNSYAECRREWMQ